MSRFWHIVKVTVFVILLLVMAVIVALQLPAVQTAITGKATEFLESQFDAKISIGKIFFKPINTIVIKDLAVIDTAPYDSTSYETFAKIGVLSVRFSLLSLAGPGHTDIRLKHVKIKDGEFNLVIEGGEYNSNLQRLFKLQAKENPEPMPEKDIIYIRDIRVENFAFRMKNYVTQMSDVPDHCVKWGDLDVNHADIKARKFKIGHGLFSGTLEEMSLREKSGWNITSLSGQAVAGKGDAIIKNIHLEDSDGSVADVDFEMIGKTDDFADFVNRVRLVADIKSSRWSLRTLARVIPPLNPDTTTFVSLTGQCEGPVADLNGTDLTLKVENSSVGLILNGGLSGLPDIQNTYYHADITGLTAGMDDLSKLLRAICGKKDIDLTKAVKGGILNADIKVNGPMNALNVNTKLTTDDGGCAEVTALVSDVINRKSRIGVKGWLKSDKLNLKTLLGNEKLGETTLSTDFSLLLASKDKPLEASLDSLDIVSAVFNDHPYTGITGKAAILGKDLTAELNSKDPAFRSDVMVWSDADNYNISVKLLNADLYRMNFDKRGKSIVAADIYAAVDKDLNNLQGKGSLSNVVMINDDGTFRIRDISLDAVKQGEDYTIGLDSEIMKGKFSGNLKHLDADFHSDDMRSLFNYVLPGLYLEEGSDIDVKMDSTGYIRGRIKAKRLAYKNHFIKDLELTAKGTIDSIAADITASRIQAYGFVMDNDSLHLTRHDSLATASYRFCNTSGDIQYGDINGGVIFGTGEGIKIIMNESSAGVNNKVWKIPSSSIAINGKEIKADNFIADCGSSYIKINGEMSETRQEELNIGIKDISLKSVNNFIKDNNFQLGGTVNLNGTIISPFTEDIPVIVADLTTDSLSIGGVFLDRLKVKSGHENGADSFFINATDSLGSKEILCADAIFTPNKSELKSDIKMDDFPFGWVKAFVPTLFSELEGYASGKCAFNIDDKGPQIESDGNVRIDDGLLKVAFTNVPYTINGDISVNDKGVHIGEMAVSDRLGHQAEISGGMNWERLKKMEMNLHLKVNEIEALDIPPNTKDAIIYGHVFGTGKVDITGPFSNLEMNVNARTVGSSDVHIVISSDMDSSRGNLLKMVNPYELELDKYDAIAEKFSKGEEKQESNFNMRLHVMGDPQLQVYLDMGGSGFAAGMQGSGNGVIDMGIGDKYNGFVMFGDYSLVEGNVDVNASNIVHRNFAINNGSSIKFNGDVMDSDVNLTAIYETKASISTLIADTSSVSNRRTILCGIGIKDKLSNPKISLSIDIPDLSPSVKSKVESALSTEDKVQRQFLSLLLSNNFLPDENSGIVNSSSLLYSNVSEMMANQVNNIFDKLDIPLDLGLNYQPTDRGDNIFDVALSTQLWNNRIIIGGSLGNRVSSSSSNETLAGDLDIQFKVNKSGSLRVKAFSHSADQYSNALDNSQRNGLGVTWQQEFNEFVEWIKQLFCSKEKREEYAAKSIEDYKYVQKFIIDE